MIRLRKHTISARYEFQESLHIDISVEYLKFPNGAVLDEAYKEYKRSRRRIKV